MPIRENRDPAPMGGPTVPRRTRINPADLEKYGYTLGCGGCESIQSRLSNRRNHTEACRVRIEKEMEATEEGRQRTGKAKERIDQWVTDNSTPNMIPEAVETPDTGGASGSTEIAGQAGADQEMCQGRSPSSPLKMAGGPKHMEEEVMIVEDEVELEEGTRVRSDVRFKTPERTPAVKRFNISTPDQDMEEDKGDATKARRLNMDDEDMSSLQHMSEIDRKIIASVILGVDITEVYSPERIAKVAREFGLNPGSSMDLTNGWDFSMPEHRRQAWKQIEKEDPYLLIGSPPCTWFSILMELNVHVNKNNPEWMAKYEREKARAIEHVNFCCSLYERQLKKGKHFLHEHPWSARSWKLEKIEKLLSNPAVALTQGHMCQFGMETFDDKKLGTTGPVKKPTGFMTSSKCLYDELSRQCKGGHVHIPLVGGRASACQVYPPELCKAVVRGVVKQKVFDKSNQVHTGKMSSVQARGFLHSMVQRCGTKVEARRKLSQLCQRIEGKSRPIGEWPDHWFDGIHDLDGGDDLRGVRPQNGTEVLKEEMNGLAKRGGEQVAWDDVTDVGLDPVEVMAARQLEMDYFNKLGVYDRVPRSDVNKTGGKLIGVRWVDINKGDATDRNYRSRLVGREFNVGKDDTLYASTPPLEALRVVVSHAATEDPSEERREIIVCDVRRAYFYAKINRDVYIELPAEDPESGGDLVGKLRLCLYGTRDAAKSWQETLSLHLESVGFKRGRGHPSVFHHPERGLKALVHGDDYVASGASKDIDWFKAELEKAYEIQTQHIGFGAGRPREGKVLNRIIRCTDIGYEVEADPRHAELVIEQMEVAEDKGVATPGVSGTEEDDQEDDTELQGEQVRMFRGIAARLNYLGPDRPDALFCIKEGCREMQKPTTGSWRRMKRIAKYLKRRPRLVWRFDMQPEPTEISVYTDADWAGCRRTRKSTSGGCMLLGKHCVKTWAKTQAIIAKSSAESELYAVVKGSCEALGLQTLMDDMGTKIDIRLQLDANAAKGIIERTGISKIRHMDVNNLWIQEQCAKKIIPTVKVDGTKNPADLMTKILNLNVIERHMEVLDLHFREGRAGKAAKLHELSRAVRQEEHKNKLSIFSFENDKADKWSNRGELQQWSREHSTARRALFTPFKVARGPGRKTKLMKVRVTEGIDEHGVHFKIEDDWTKPENSHRLLSASWVGRTTFGVDAEEDVDLGGDYRRQRSRACTSSAAHETCTTAIVQGKSKFVWADACDTDESTR